jgi:hypothetical protein
MSSQAAERNGPSGCEILSRFTDEDIDWLLQTTPTMPDRVAKTAPLSPSQNELVPPRAAATNLPAIDRSVGNPADISCGTIPER